MEQIVALLALSRLLRAGQIQPDPHMSLIACGYYRILPRIIGRAA